VNAPVPPVATRRGRITVHDLTKQFGPVTAVAGLSFAVEPGVVTGFLGPNGSGKTTTLRMILGLVTPTAGEARIGGLRFSELGSVESGHPARVVGAVLDAEGFHPARTARRHLLACAAAIGVSDARVLDALGLVGLVADADRPVGAFSLGMTQRLALAAALLGDPQALVLDEPGNGLDPEGIAWLRSFLRGFARQGRTVLFSSHLLTEVEQTADHLVVITGGRCVYQGGLAQLRASRRCRVLVHCAAPVRLAEALARSGVSEIDSLPDGRLAVGADPVRVGDTALGAGVAIYGMVEERIDLEQLFFQLTAGSAGGPPHWPAGRRW
jgi:ABC-2 type transport system ATP-binding protein